MSSETLMHAGLTATRICQLLALVLGAHLLSRHSAASAVRSRTPPAASARRTASAPAGLSALTYVVACYRLRRPESTSCAGEELSRDFYKALLREFKFRFPGNATMLRYSPKSPEEIECQGGEQCEVVSPLEWSERGGDRSRQKACRRTDRGQRRLEGGARDFSQAHQVCQRSSRTRACEEERPGGALLAPPHAPARHNGV